MIAKLLNKVAAQNSNKEEEMVFRGTPHRATKGKTNFKEYVNPIFDM